MGHSQAKRAASHARILAEAAADIRARALDPLMVARLMRRAGLTHGGFYGHFASRADLLAQALACALADGDARARAATSFAGFVRAYLSDAHRDAPQEGCALAALVSELAHADAACRSVA